MTWEQVYVDCPQQSKYVFFTNYLHMGVIVRCFVQLLMFQLNFTFAYAMATIVVSSSWSSWTCFLSKVVCFVSHRLTCGTCAKNASPAKFPTSPCGDQPAPTPPLIDCCLFPFMACKPFPFILLYNSYMFPFTACKPSPFILPYKLSYVHLFHFRYPEYRACTYSIHVYMFHLSAICIWYVMCCW